MNTSYSKILQVATLVVLLSLLISMAAYSATATILVSKDGAKTPGGGWYNYYQGSAKLMYTNDFCFFYADVLSAITAPGFVTKINSATLDIYTYSTSGTVPATFRVFTGNTPWDEASGPFPGWDTEYASSTMYGDGYQHIDVAAMVQDWVDGKTNNGVGINSGLSTSAAAVAREEISPDWDTAEPHFTIDYTQTPGTSTATASILVTKDGAQIPGGGAWYDYYQGGAKFMYTNDFCYFYADLLPEITTPGFKTTIQSATLDVYTYSTTGSLPGTFSVFTGNTAWDEASGPFPGWDTDYASSPMNGDGYQHINVAAVVQDWVDGKTNNGVGINSGLANTAAVVASEEISPDWDTAEPHFTIKYIKTLVPQTASILVTKDGAQIPGGGAWYDYLQGGAKFMYSNDFCYFYADVLSEIVTPGFITSIDSATLDIYTYSTNGTLPGTFKVFTGNTPWDEASGPFPGWDTDYASSPMSGDGYQHINVAAVVQDWVDGKTNNGVGINSGLANSAAIVASEEISPDWDTAEPHYTINYYKTPIALIADAKKSPLGSIVGLTGSITAVFDGKIYVEASDRASGIRVDKADHGFLADDVGKVINVIGSVAKDPVSNEIYIAARSISTTAQTNLIQPLGLTNKNMGGGDLTNSTTGNGQVGVVGGVGLNNIGLLVRITGLASAGDANGFTVTDGSGVTLNVSLAGAGSAYNGQYVVVTGISSIGSGGVRVISARSAGDVLPVF